LAAEALAKESGVDGFNGNIHSGEEGMKLQYLFMAYIIIVIARFYCRAIREELRDWRQRSERILHR
jgi:hypothetical protein